MANIIDLSVLVKESRTVKISETEQFTLPGNVSTQFTMELMAFYAKIQGMELEINKAKDVDEVVKKSEELIGLLKELTLKILQQDKSRTFDMEYINTHLDNIDMMRAVIEIGMGKVKEIENDPN